LIGGLSTAATFESFVVLIRSKASRFQGNTIGHTENAMRVCGPTTTESDSESRRAITSISGSSPEPLRQPSGLAEPDYGWRICAAVYGTDTWPIDETVCIALAEEIGFAADLFRATLEDPETERVLAAAAEEAFRRGAFGVPTFFVGAQMFWGNDRLTILKYVLKKRSLR
jgi:hypothetical protein